MTTDPEQFVLGVATANGARTVAAEDEWRRRACEVANRGLTAAERRGLDAVSSERDIDPSRPQVADGAGTDPVARHPDWRRR